MDKQKVAATILGITEQLNKELVEAFNAKLKVMFSTDYTWPTEEASRNSCPLVFIDLKVTDSDVLAQTVNPKHVKTPWRMCDHIFGQMIAWTSDIMKADVYEQCSKCGTKRLYTYPMENL